MSDPSQPTPQPTPQDLPDSMEVQLVAMLHGELSDADRAACEAQVASDLDLADQYKRLAASDGLIREAREEWRLPDQKRADLLKKLGKEPERVTQARSRRRQKVILYAAAVMIALAAVGRVINSLPGPESTHASTTERALEQAESQVDLGKLPEVLASINQIDELKRQIAVVELTVSEGQVVETMPDEAQLARLADRERRMASIAELPKVETEPLAIDQDAIGQLQAQQEALQLVEDHFPNGQIPELAKLLPLVEQLEGELEESLSHYREQFQVPEPDETVSLAEPMRSQISKVYSAWAFVVIEGGHDLGMQLGQRYTIERRGQPIGQLKISQVDPSYSIGKIVSGTMHEQTQLVPGDQVVVVRE